jgi:hypothetical protein
MCWVQHAAQLFMGVLANAVVCGGSHQDADRRELACAVARLRPGGARMQAAALCRVLLQPPRRGFPALCPSCCAAVVAAIVAAPRSDKEVSVKQVKPAELGWGCAQLFCCCCSARHYGAKECCCVCCHVWLLKPVGPWTPAQLAVGSCRAHRAQSARLWMPRQGALCPGPNVTALHTAEVLCCCCGAS